LQKSLLKNISFFGKAFFFKERFVLKEKNIRFFDKTFFHKESFPSSFGKAFLLKKRFVLKEKNLNNFYMLLLFLINR